MLKWKGVALPKRVRVHANDPSSQTSFQDEPIPDILASNRSTQRVTPTLSTTTQRPTAGKLTILN